MSATNNVYGSPGEPEIREAKPPKPPRNDALKSARLLIIFLLIIILAVFVARSVLVVVHQNEYIVIRQFGKIVSISSEPQLTYKIPFIQTVLSVPKDIQLYNLPISDVITQDKKTMVADSFVLWRITDPKKFIEFLGGSVGDSETHIGKLVYNSMKTVISNLSQNDIISNRNKLSDSIFDNIGNSLDDYGIELIAIETKHLDLPDDNKQAVYERMISERNNIAAAFKAEGDSEATKIRNETDKSISIRLSQAGAEAERTISEGEAEYMRILSEAYSTQERADFYSFVRSLDAARESLKGSDKTLILSKDSPIARLFYSLG